MENIRPIKTETDYDWAIAEITRYFDNEPVPGTRDADRFDVLAELIEAYEAKHYPIEQTDPVEAILAHMEMANLGRSALVDVLGSASRASEILKRKRALTMDMAFRLNRAWHIPAEVLITPYHLDTGKGERERA
ncbi:MAG: XRE family transcriptional regulator [Mesorhizobium sp.]|uniref:helix-turn-helix domain-containing protein n=1 Tax=Mesorhizobium sp. TaxID=1871066 RepID=UPI000FE98B0E|nr:XRE family transcriptional regulator [Mesorhizobium sp.]RWM05352.1 MAG: XRE family transcriptional regulator [Mesorhizobium sp.]TIO51939.1 MAG: XRE family transcriptional regulator [Mesorhizobium sp.]TIO58099.1 MAG: XRE family transcriptional regulator [Mesorhizobium sp.]TJV59098.1 MAG: XRE family transcriptional regulator [Mesorhizobium sp.]